MEIFKDFSVNISHYTGCQDNQKDITIELILDPDIMKCVKIGIGGYNRFYKDGWEVTLESCNIKLKKGMPRVIKNIEMYIASAECVVDDLTKDITAWQVNLIRELIGQGCIQDKG